MRPPGLGLGTHSASDRPPLDATAERPLGGAGGKGTGAGLGSQGSVLLDRAGDRRYVVNAGSDELSVFDVRDDVLVLRAIVSSGGANPIRDEGRAMAAVRHPGVVTVHGVGRHRDLDYLVMERIHGVNLHAMIDQRYQARLPFTIAEALDLLLAITDALIAVRASGISHCDVKPANIMVTPARRPVLMDFGLARPEYLAQDPDVVAGSPHYMAPEIVSGRALAGSGHLADLYSIGVIAFMLLTGDVPFPRPTVQAALVAHLTAAPPDLRQLRPDVPDALSALVGRLLAKSPHDRPLSAEAVGWDLAAIRAGRDPRRRRPSVLIVDDERELIDLIVAHLRLTLPDVELSFATSAEAALREVARRPPKVMVLDLHMPGMTGIELCMYLRGTEATAGLTIVSMSGAAQPADVQLLAELGVSRFVAKGVSLLPRLTELLAELTVNA